MAAAHASGVKIPGLFIYFNVPSHAYQDRIIALLTAGWAAFFWITARKMDRELIKLILGIGALAIIALTLINLTTAFSSFSARIDTRIFHVETGLLLLYWMILMVLYHKNSGN